MDADHAIVLLAAAERDRLPGVPFIEPEALDRAIHLVLPDGRVLVGADAVFAVLRQLPRWRWLAGMVRIPGVGLLADRLYRWIAARRHRLR
jgi:predicted DCC family thiol-disulfide oxidoreductase YuxK